MSNQNVYGFRGLNYAVSEFKPNQHARIRMPFIIAIAVLFFFSFLLFFLWNW